MLCPVSQACVRSSAGPLFLTDKLATRAFCGRQRRPCSLCLHRTCTRGLSTGSSPSASVSQPQPFLPDASLAASSSGAPDLHGVVAHSPLEDALLELFSPTQLGVQFWEAAHASSGLPWWAAIPAATLALRTALLPLSLQAYAASANILLLHRSIVLSREVSVAVEAASSSGNAPADDSTPGATSAPAAEAPTQPQPSASAALGRVELTRRLYAQLRAEQGTVPPFGWYLANAAVQVTTSPHACTHRAAWGAPHSAHASCRRAHLHARAVASLPAALPCRRLWRCSSR